jgi:hypothetical protein
MAINIIIDGALFQQYSRICCMQNGNRSPSNQTHLAVK